MRMVFSLLLAVGLAEAAVRADDSMPGGGLAGVAGGGDQFERAMMEVITAAAKEGKKITVKRIERVPGDGMTAPRLFPRAGPATSVVAVEIRDPDTPGEPPQQFLLRNQEEILKALNALCEGQVESGGKLSSISALGTELGQTMGGLSNDVERVNEGVSATGAQVGDVAEATQDSAVILEGIREQMKELNQTVQSLLSSMDGVEEEISALASSAGEEDGEAGSTQGDESGESSDREAEGECETESPCR